MRDEKTAKPERPAGIRSRLGANVSFPGRIFFLNERAQESQRSYRKEYPRGPKRQKMLTLRGERAGRRLSLTAIAHAYVTVDREAARGELPPATCAWRGVGVVLVSTRKGVRSRCGD
jgi:hypothetical protein